MIFKKITDKTKGFLEIVTSHDDLKAIYNQLRNLHENNIPVHGFVTIIKNKGKHNEEIIQEDITNLLTLSGRDFFHAQVYTNIGAGTVAANFIALSDEGTDPIAADTILLGEITANGLERVLAGSISHTLLTNITTLENVFTATAIFTGVHKSALFNQLAVGGQMTHASEFIADVNLQISDTITVTWTLALG